MKSSEVKSIRWSESSWKIAIDEISLNYSQETGQVK